jgi:Mg-chelatase subunit ChlD
MGNYRISFESPAYLLLLVLVLWIWWFSFHRLRSFGIIRRLTAIALRTSVVVLLILALAEVQMVRISDRMTVLYLVDESLSVPEDRRLAEARYVNAAIRRHRHGGDRAGVIVFGREAAIEVPPYDDAVQMLQRIESPISGDNTDISAAMRLAEASFPEDSARRVVLISDGGENLGNAVEQAQSLVRAGVGIDVLPIRFRPRGEIIVERVTVPNDLRLGQPFDLKVVITNTAEAKAPPSSMVRGKLQISVTEQGRTRLISDDLVELPPGKKVFTLRPKPINAAGFYNYTARFIPLRPEDDAMEQNNRASGFTQVRGKGQVLLIEDGQHRGQFERMVEALRREKLDVTVRPSGESFAALAELQQYDAVLLANVPRDEFSDEQIAMLVRNTQQLGCGLVMLGATGSFGAGDWTGSELEKAMPVDFRIKNLKVMPRGALAMLMHATEVDVGNFWQKKIAQQAIGALGERDFCGVIHFDNWGTGMKWLWSPALSIVGPNRDLMVVQLDRMIPGDMPDFEPGMKACLQALVNVQEAAVRHVIVISDGDPQPPTQATINALVKAKITVSTVAVGAHGPAESRSMASIASQTSGKYYKVNNPNALPKIFQREARRVAQPLVYKDPKGFQPKVVHYHEIVNGISNPLPPISGYVLTSKKENPLVEVLMRCPVPGKEENCTLLASWPYGLGKTVAFTTDSGFSLANQWTGWDDYDKLFGQMVRWAMRPVNEEGKFTVATDFKDGKVRVVVSALDKNDEFQNFLDMSATAVSPELKPIDLRMEQTAPGRYVGQFPAADPGSYMVMLSPGPGKAPLRTGINVPYSDEFRGLATNETLLARLAKLVPKGGAAGRLIDAPEEFQERDLDKLLAVDSFRHDLKKATSNQDVWNWAVLAASCLLLFDVFVRRVQVSVPWDKAWGFLLRRKPAPAATPTIERLRSRKAEVGSQLEQLRAATRFEAPPGAAAELPGSARPAPADKPSAAPAAPSPAGEPSKEESYTSRLLKAKKNAFEPKKE